MAAQLIDGKALSAEVRSRVRARVQQPGRQVRLDAVLVGSHPSAELYAASQARTCDEAGIAYVLHRIDAESGFDQIAQRVIALNQDERVRAIMVHLPLPQGVDVERVQSLIAATKDVEGVNPVNIGNVVYGRRSLVPCTARAVIELIESCKRDLRGVPCVCVGASNIVGKPIAVLLMQAQATVTSCNKHTHNASAIASEADVLVVAAGVPHLVTAEWVRPGAIVIDVGIHRVKAADGVTNTIGDVHYESVRQRAGFVTPVPGGVGPMTVAMLLSNVVDACREP